MSFVTAHCFKRAPRQSYIAYTWPHGAGRVWLIVLVRLFGRRNLENGTDLIGMFPVVTFLKWTSAEHLRKGM